METKYNFTKMSLAEFGPWLQRQRVARNIQTIQQHHTWKPYYLTFKRNHFDLQTGMRNFHVGNNGWIDIAQHFTIFPDGSIMTGRTLEQTPVGIFGRNSGAICLEHLGNFDHGADAMSSEQKETIIRITALLCSKFNIPVNNFGIVYHHWFDLATGSRNGGTFNNKSCPGTNFFGGNKESDCEQNFLPLVRQAMNDLVINPGPANILKYVIVTAISGLNIRQEPTGRSKKAENRKPAEMGAVLRVFEERNGWYKISESQSHWIAGRFTIVAKRATVKANRLNIRSGPGIKYLKSGELVQGESIYCTQETGRWCRLGIEDNWVSKHFLSFN